MDDETAKELGEIIDAMIYRDWLLRIGLKETHYFITHQREYYG